MPIDPALAVNTACNKSCLRIEELCVCGRACARTCVLVRVCVDA